MYRDTRIREIKLSAFTRRTDLAFGSTLRLLREQHHMTQLDLARLAVCSVDTISLWEQGQKTPRMRTIRMLAGIFSISPEELLTGDFDAPPDYEKRYEELFERLDELEN